MHPVQLAADMRINAISAAMVALGISLFVVTLRYWHGAGEDPEVLAPLEVMGDRKFARADDAGRTQILNSVRPEGAEMVGHIEAAGILDHEPPQQNRPYRDPFDHTDDAVDVAPQVIDPLLSQNKEMK